MVDWFGIVPGLEIPDRKSDRIDMAIQTIRELNRTNPFIPYEIRMVSGERYLVPHPNFISVSPKGTFVIVYGNDETPHHLSSFLIERNGHHKRARKKK